VQERLRKDKYAGSKATRVHLFAHRYPKAKESIKDRNHNHAGVMLQWDHEKFSTIVEFGWWNAVGATGCALNCEDRGSALSKVMPECMRIPWESDRAELRVMDVPLKDEHALEQYFKKFTPEAGLPLKEQRFLAPEVFRTGNVRLRLASQVEIVGYLLSYIRTDTSYDLLRRNCQHFAADFFGFLTATKNVKPYHAGAIPGYTERHHAFLYTPKPDH